jgi:hypothetical protein
VASDRRSGRTPGGKAEEGEWPLPHVIKIAQTRLRSRCKQIMPGVTAIPDRYRFCEGV